MYTVYALVDPCTTEIRYIGQTQNHPTVRLGEHLAKEDTNRQKLAWFEYLRRLDTKPLVVTLERAGTLEDALRIENQWIAFGIRIGWDLLNKTNGKSARRHMPHSKNERKLNVITTDDAGRWDDVVAAWFATHPAALTGPAVGVSDLARAMCRDNEAGSDANYEAYKGRAHKLFHEFRAAVHLPNGDRLGVDVSNVAD